MNPQPTKQSPPAVPEPAAQAAAEIVLEHTSRWYGNVVAVNDISMNIGAGVTGLLGPNGAGKSTLLHLMAGFLEPSAGTLTIDGEPVRLNEPIYRKIGLVPERDAVYAFLTGWQFVLASARLHRLPDPALAARTALEIVDLSDAQGRRIDTYSKGMRQRAKVAAAIVHDPPVLLLDEPFNGMDPRQRMHLMDLIRTWGDGGKTIVFSSHILEEVERVAEQIEVVVAGRHAASGDFRAIRRLMADRPHIFSVRSSDDRRLAEALVADASIGGVSFVDGELSIQALDFHRFTRLLPRAARTAGVRLNHVAPSDESLESVFSYLVES